MRRFTRLGAAAAALGLLVLPAHARPADVRARLAAGAGATMELEPPAGAPGTQVVATLRGFPARAFGIVVFGRSPVATVRTDQAGGAQAAFSVPAGAAGSVAVRAAARFAVAATTFAVTGPASPRPTTPPPPSDGVWRPQQATSWQWQLSGAVDTSVSGAVFDVDGFDNDAGVVATLHGQGKRVVCYLSAGSYESWRPDASRFPASVRGLPLSGFPDEQWLDIRQTDVLEPIMRDRAAMCAGKGFDAIEWDNVDGYQNTTGFPLSASDQLAYNRLLAGIAHDAGLGAALKNDIDQIAALEPDFEFAVNEQCFEFDECGAYAPFLSAGKAVLHVEYNLPTSAFCAQANAMGFSSMRKNLELDAYREACFPV